MKCEMLYFPRLKHHFKINVSKKNRQLDRQANTLKYPQKHNHNDRKTDMTDIKLSDYHKNTRRADKNNTVKMPEIQT